VLNAKKLGTKQKKPGQNQTNKASKSSESNQKKSSEKSLDRATSKHGFFPAEGHSQTQDLEPGRPGLNGGNN
jgi:hypothetical protein